ncbi:uncharacterized protein LOC124885805 [Capsicum annuum]|uniref:uncharacterized protein LOC124885805 n=1 Tax=Capsicum annuum TaxID=4072 RepID=UPI001FB15A74|nr:uncharacterized protein LOC124885805 [Capsicum annuum]
MSEYTKLMKDLMINKRRFSYDPGDNLHHYSTIATRSLVQKKTDPGAFTVPYTIRAFNFAKDLCDLGASINLIPFVVFKYLVLGYPMPTNIWFLMADRSMKKSVEILYDVLVNVDSFIFLVDFRILDCEVDFEVTIILGRLFLSTRRVLIDLDFNELKFRLNDEEVSFDICQSMRPQKEMSVVPFIDVLYDDDMEVSIEEMFVVETLAIV